MALLAARRWRRAGRWPRGGRSNSRLVSRRSRAREAGRAGRLERPFLAASRMARQGRLSREGSWVRLVPTTCEGREGGL
jgi:hypothetical protein